METAELEARANARAHEERVHIFSVPGRPGVYVTKSKSDPTQKYYLAVSGAHTGSPLVACNCKGFFAYKTCKHSQALYNRLGREAPKQPEPPRRRAQVSDLYE